MSQIHFWCLSVRTAATVLTEVKCNQTIVCVLTYVFKYVQCADVVWRLLFLRRVSNDYDDEVPALTDSDVSSSSQSDSEDEAGSVSDEEDNTRLVCNLAETVFEDLGLVAVWFKFNAETYCTNLGVQQSLIDPKSNLNHQFFLDHHIAGLESNLSSMQLAALHETPEPTNITIKLNN